MELLSEVVSYEEKKNPTKDVEKYKVLEGTSHPEKSMQIANECINSPRISNN